MVTTRSQVKKFEEQEKLRVRDIVLATTPKWSTCENCCNDMPLTVYNFWAGYECDRCYSEDTVWSIEDYIESYGVDYLKCFLFIEVGDSERFQSQSNNIFSLKS